jgi:16S rRNA (adenine1518-N6/adenine1519-N6)-dimethyltransferase
LIDPSPIHTSIQASCDLGLSNDSHVLEIGPGPGVLSIELLRLGSKLTAIEISQDACDFLESELNHEQFNLINEDALSTKWPDDITHIVANIPYGISSPILERIQDHHQSNPLDGISLLVQREFAHRMAMKSIPKDRGPLGIALWLDFECEIISDVPSSSFRPQPDVASSIVTLRPVSRTELQGVSRKLVRGISSWCFGRRRRKIRTSLRGFPRRMLKIGKWSSADWLQILNNLENGQTPRGTYARSMDVYLPYNWKMIENQVYRDLKFNPPLRKASGRPSRTFERGLNGKEGYLSSTA